MSTRDALAGLTIFVLALALRVAYVHEAEQVLALDVSKLVQTDNHVFNQWARVIADGDLLCRNQPHAQHLWTDEVAPESRWLEWYGGKQTFHQAPLYPYVLAGIFTLFGRTQEIVGYVQAVFGALTCWLTWLLARRLISPLAGLVAGGSLALMGAFYFYDAFLLRDSFMALLTVLLALAGDSALKHGRARDWLATGAALGLFTLGKETGSALLAFAVLLVCWTWRRQPRRAATAAVLMGLGWLALCSPAFVRNRLVDAPTFKLSTRGPEVFVAGNAYGQDGVGWEPPIGTMRRILMDSNFQLLPTVEYTVATHRAEPWGYVALLWNKTRAFFNAYEEPNNVNFELFRAHLPTLRMGFVSMWFLAPAALLGLFLGLPRRRTLAVPYLLFFALSASVIALYILGRFRLQVLPLMALFAALSVDWAWRKLRERRRVPLFAAALAFAVLLAWTRRPPEIIPFNEQNRDAGMIFQLVKAGNYPRALVFLDNLRRLKSSPEGVITDVNLATKLDTLASAFPWFERAMAWPDDSSERHLLTGQGLLALLPITERGERKEFTGLARHEFMEALRIHPAIEGAHVGLGRIAVINDDPSLAYAEFSLEIVEHPQSVEAHLGMGLLQLTFNQPVEALRHFRNALAAGAAEDARILASMALIQINPTLKQAPPIRIGGQLEPVYDPPRALVQARRALELAPDDPLVRENAAYVLYVNSFDNIDEAVALLRSVQLDIPTRYDELEGKIQGILSLKPKRSDDAAPPTDEPTDAQADAPSDAPVDAPADPATDPPTTPSEDSGR